MTDVPPLPEGRVTLVFTDVEGSTTLWERDPQAMRAALEVHDELLRALSEEMGGVVARTLSDTFLVAWEDPVQALRWCLRVQQALLDQDWPEAILEQPEAAAVIQEEHGVLHRGLRVRMGAHLGRPLVEDDPGTWGGPVVRRAARLAGAAHGGQILVTDRVWKAVEGGLEDQVVSVDLGPHRFRGLSGLVRLVEVRPEALAPRSFPPLRTVDSERTNVIPEADAWIGRDPDLSALAELFGFGVRMVTVVGPTGSGRSRLVREFAGRYLDRWAGEDQGGAWVCDLADARDRAGLLQAVGSALDIPLTLGRTGADTVTQIGHALASRGPILLVLDGFESLGTESADAVTAWLRLAPTVRLLATADRRLGVEREVAYELSCLGLTDEGHPASASAIRLLVRRLRERGEGVRLSREEQRRAGRLLTLAGGLPLAIEMLAGQIGAHPLGELQADVAGRLEHPDQATPAERLQAVFDTCLSRLRPWERGALARCSVFRGGFDLQAAEATIDLSEWAGAPWVGDAVERLRELGLLRSTEAPSTPGAYRFDLHPFVRDAIAASFPPTDRAATRDRHAAWYVGWGRPWADQVHGDGGTEALSRLDQERQNLIAAVESSLEVRPLTRARIERALEGVLILAPLLSTRGPFETELRLLDEVLEASEAMADVDPRRLVRVLRQRGEARRLRGRWAEAREDLERALELARDAGDSEGEVAVLGSLGQLLRLLGSPSEALTLLEDALKRTRALGMRRDEGLVLGNMGVVHLHLGHGEEARASIGEAIEVFRSIGDRRNEGVQIGNLGVIHRRLGDLERTQELYWEALDIHRETGDRRREGVMLGNLGVLQYHVGNLEAAFDLYDQALALAREVGDRRSEATALANIGLVYTEQRNHDDALGLFHQALALNRDVGERVGEGCDAGFLGALHHLQGDLEKAADHYRRALDLLDREAERRYAGSFLSWAAACAADRGDLDEADALFEQAGSCLDKAGDPHLLGAREILLGAVDLARAQAGVEAGDQVEAAKCREAARTRMMDVRARVEQSDEPLSGDLRLAIQWLEGRLGDLA